MDKLIKYARELKLLYVEDDEYTRKLFKEMLSDTFEEIILASDGVDALDKLQKNKIDLIITDINMPNMDGLEMTQEIKKMGIDIPIIILSAHMKSEYFLKSIKLNVKGYLLKPFDIDSLFEILKDVLSNMKLQD